MPCRRIPGLALALIVMAALAACDDSEPDSSQGGSSTSAPATTATTAPTPPPPALTVAYTRTYTSDDNPPPERYRAEISSDGVSFRMIADDGTADFAYDGATGTAYEWSRSASDAQGSATLIRGLVSGGPGGFGLSDGPDRDMSVLVRTLGRAGDPRVKAVTTGGRPAWRYDGPTAGDRLGGSTIGGRPVYEDHVVFDVDRATGVVLLEVQSGQGRETRRLEATSVEERPTEERSRYRPQPPATARIATVDRGFRAMTLDEVAATAGYDVLVPGSVPEGFELDEVLFDPREPFHSGPEGLNPAPSRVTSMRWRHTSGAGFTVTLLPERGDADAEQSDQVWTDPLASEGVETPATEASIPIEDRPPLKGELVVAAPAVPHVWGISGGLVIAVAGDLDGPGLEAVVRSLRKHVAAAPSSARPLSCPAIGFTPNSDDVAGEITATEVDCTEAGALVRRVTEARRMGRGSRYFRQDGYTCRGVFSDGPGLANTAFRCDDGARRVTWKKT